MCDSFHMCYIHSSSALSTLLNGVNILLDLSHQVFTEIKHTDIHKMHMACSSTVFAQNSLIPRKFVDSITSDLCAIDGVV
jgi:hypothetical protein